MKSEWLERSLITGPYVILVLNKRQFNQAMKDCNIQKSERGDWIKNQHSDATVHFLENPSGEQCCIVALRAGKKTTADQIVGLLIHESVHIWQRFKRRISEVNPSDEFEAYSIQAIAQGLIEAYSKLTLKGEAK